MIIGLLIWAVVAYFANKFFYGYTYTTGYWDARGGMGGGGAWGFAVISMSVLGIMINALLGGFFAGIIAFGGVVPDTEQTINIGTLIGAILGLIAVPFAYWLGQKDETIPQRD